MRHLNSWRISTRRLSSLFVGWSGCGCLVLVLLLSGSLASQACMAQPPNVVLILADDMGYGDVQTLNPDSIIPTPHLNRLASEGMTFADAHSPSAVCTPTRYGLLTGRCCWRSSLKRGVLGGYSSPLLDHDQITIAEMLRKAGYQTAAVGKWHLGMSLPMLEKAALTEEPEWKGDPGVDFAGEITNGPTHHGFDHYFGVTASLDMPPYVYVRDTRFTSLPSIQQPAVKFPHFVRAGPRAEDFVIDQVLDRLAEEAVDFIGRAAAEDRPFFLYMPLTGPHKPTQPHQRFQGKTGLNDYGDFVHQVDWTVGQVLEALDTNSIAEETMVVFTSDNGSYMYRIDPSQPDHVDQVNVQGFHPQHHRANANWRGTKADIWEAGHHVPCFVRWPGHAASGARCTAPVCLTDLYATLADAAGTKVGRGQAQDSVSWNKLLHGESNMRGRPVVHHSAGGMFAIRDGQWKLVLGNGSGGREKPKGKPFEGPFQLFNLEEDPEEQHDVAAEQVETVMRLSRELMKLMAQ